MIDSYSLTDIWRACFYGYAVGRMLDFISLVLSRISLFYEKVKGKAGQKTWSCAWARTRCLGTKGHYDIWVTPPRIHRKVTIAKLQEKEVKEHNLSTYNAIWLNPSFPPHDRWHIRHNVTKPQTKKNGLQNKTSQLIIVFDSACL